MKNLKFLSMMLMLMVGLVSFSACSDDDDDNNAALDKDGNVSILGSWTYSSEDDQTWNSKNTLIETLTFNNNNTGKVTGTITRVDPASGNSATNSLSGVFDYQLTWNNGVGTLRIANVVGDVGYLEEGTYTLRIDGTNKLTTTVLSLFGKNYRKK